VHLWLFFGGTGDRRKLKDVAVRLGELHVADLVVEPGEGGVRRLGLLAARRLRPWPRRRGIQACALGKSLIIIKKMQCCRSGSGIQCLFDPWIRDRDG
jgi:hypothetical protein